MGEDLVDSSAFETLLHYVKHNRGFDFTGYKRTSLMRRVQRRMQSVSIADCSEYLDYLQVHPEEFAHLFNTVLINVTAFFRDPAAWEHLGANVLPKILANKEAGLPIRIWCAGAASGQEAYTVAMLLAEQLGEQMFRERVKIYATDVDEEALTQARLAAYSARDMANLQRELIERYFEPAGQRYVFRKDMRRSIIFGRHDLVQDAPISRIDLITCRNTLMYFNAETQARILGHFHFALNDQGFLFLGKSEMLLTHGSLFTPADLKCRVFMKVPRHRARERTYNPLSLAVEPNGTSLEASQLRDIALDCTGAAQIAVDMAGCVLMANHQARMLFGLTLQDINRPLQDLEMSYRPLELRSRIEEAYAERRSVLIREVHWPVDGTPARYFDVLVTPLAPVGGPPVGVLIAFTDVTRYRYLQDELGKAKHELETAHEELQSTVEELETTNEELQSTNEELETTNEELQSTNEELETMNEELQSTNEELETMNGELRLRTLELHQVNGFFESILTSLRVGVVVVDRDLRVQIWNDKSEDLWGLRLDEVLGQHFLNLDIGLPVERLKGALRACLTRESEGESVTVTATNRRGRSIACKVGCVPLQPADGLPKGVIMLMEDRDADGESL